MTRRTWRDRPRADDRVCVAGARSRAPARVITITEPWPSPTWARHSSPARCKREMCEYTAAWLMPNTSCAGSMPDTPRRATHRNRRKLPGPGLTGLPELIAPPASPAA